MTTIIYGRLGPQTPGAQQRGGKAAQRNRNKPAPEMTTMQNDYAAVAAFSPRDVRWCQRRGMREMDMCGRLADGVRVFEVAR